MRVYIIMVLCGFASTLYGDPVILVANKKQAATVGAATCAASVEYLDMENQKALTDIALATGVRIGQLPAVLDRSAGVWLPIVTTAEATIMELNMDNSPRMDRLYRRMRHIKLPIADTTARIHANAYIQLCGQVAISTNKTCLNPTEFRAALTKLKGVNKTFSSAARRASSLLQEQLREYYGPRWWRIITWDMDASIVGRTEQLLVEVLDE